MTSDLKKFFSAKLRLPSLSQWRNFFHVLNKKEKAFFFLFFFLFLCSFSFLAIDFYYQHTKMVPAAGGKYEEGVVGQPRFLNPALANSDVDRDLIELIFSGLTKYNEKGEIVPDLMKDFQIKEEGKIYEISLREDVFWHDGKKITADDVLFTIKTIQDPGVKSPQMANWMGIDVEKISDTKLVFRLRSPYFPFLERLTAKILPKHIFEEVLPENFGLTIYNLEPVGSGPFEFKEIRYNNLGRVESLTLKRHLNYFGEPPYLEEIIFLFFETEENLITAAAKNEVQALATLEFKNIEFLKTKGFDLHLSVLPRYFAVFFNPEKSEFLGKKEVRQALLLAVDKKELLEKVINRYGKIASSPILPEIYGFETLSQPSGPDLKKAKELLGKVGFAEQNGQLIKIQTKEKFLFTKKLELGSQGEEVKSLQRCLSQFSELYPEGTISGYFGKSTETAVKKFQEKYKEEILDPWGFKEGTGIVAKTTREKLNEVCNQFPQESFALKFSLVTVNQPLLIETANLLKSQWEKLGAEIEILALDFKDLDRDFIKPREYQMLLFGEALGTIPDPFPFWHSSRVEDPGLNLAMYKNKKADEFLKKAREAQSFEEMRENLENFQEILLDDVPAIFLYSPDFLYLTSEKIGGVSLEKVSEPSKRFVGVENWYIKTQRVLK